MEPKLMATVGLEIHIRLRTGRKLFCRCAYDFQAAPNTQVCPVCLGLPGSLPVLDQKVVDMALSAGLALGCHPNPTSEFSRKNYFYPDLPRNYQITQFERPLLSGGSLALPGGSGKEIRLRRIHVEEDAGRSQALTGTPGTSDLTQVDCNRAGTPLMEIVTEPDLETGSQARLWLRRLLQILEYLDVCDGNLAEGSLRCDANVGLVAAGREVESAPWSEIKNLNSFRSISMAVDHEIQRLKTEISAGSQPVPQTRSWDPGAGQTRFLRFKEETKDYRYFPEPDLPLLKLTSERIEMARSNLPELPAARENRLQVEHGLSLVDAGTICQTRPLAGYFEAVLRELEDTVCPRLASTWVLGPVLREVEKQGLDCLANHISPVTLAELLSLLAEESITATVAHSLFDQLATGQSSGSLREIVEAEGLGQIKDLREVRELCLRAIADHPKQVAEIKRGKSQVLNFLVGRVQALSSGRADPSVVRQILRAEIINES